MKNLFKKMLDIPIQYSIVIGVSITILIVLSVQGEITPLFALGIAVLALLFILQAYLGSVVIKSILASLVVIYSAALYTDAVMSLHGNIVEPFLLTIAAVTLFLAQTYDKKNLNYGIRSRILWSSMLAFLLVTLKLSFILSNYSFIVAEVIGLNLFIIYVALWRLWLNNSKKTKVISPNVEKEEVIDKFKFIYIKDRLNARESQWLGFELKRNNAYPYIFSEVLKANDEGLNLVIVSTVVTDRVYDVEEIELNRATSIPYMYIEAKENDYMDDAMEGFAEEVQRKRK